MLSQIKEFFNAKMKEDELEENLRVKKIEKLEEADMMKKL